MAKHPKPRPQYQLTFLREWRKHRGKTQEQLAEAVGISAAQVNRIEKGKRQYTQAFLEAAAEYLQTDPASLLMRDPIKGENIWSLWERANVGQRQDIERLAEIVVEKNHKAG